MQRGLAHKIARLQAMSVAEIYYRARLALADKWHRHQHAKDKITPELDAQLLQQTWDGYWRRTKLPSQQEFLHHFPDAPQHLFHKADKILTGELELLGHAFHFSQWDWQRDPQSGFQFPYTWWSNINIYAVENLQVKYVWELNRHQHFVTLSQAYYLSQDEKYAKALCAQWQSWLHDNPPYIGINWHSALEIAIRLISWTWALRFVQNSTALNKELFAEILASITLQTQHIERHLSKYSSANNHLIGEAVGLVYTGAFFPELPQAKKWRRLGYKILQKEILQQTFADGVSQEQAVHYEKFVLDLAILAAHALQPHQQKFSLNWQERVSHMSHFLFMLMDEHGNIPQIGDADDGIAVQLSATEKNPYMSSLNTCAAFLNTDFLAQHDRQQALWLFPEKFKKEQKTVSTLAQPQYSLFLHGGYGIICADKQHLCFDFGSLGLGKLAAHGHADALSIWLSVNGRPALVDSGTFAYLGAGDLRSFFRGTAAHNTVCIDAQNQSQILGPFQWGRKTQAKLLDCSEDENSIRMAATHNGYRHLGVQHIRRVEWIKNSAKWQITDIIKSNARHEISVYFHLDEADIRIQAEQAHCTFADFYLNFIFSANQKFVLIAHQGESSPFWQSPQFGIKKHSSVLECRATVPKTFQLITQLQADV